MGNHVKDKSIIVTGAAGGFGRLVSEKAAALGAKVTCADVDLAALEASVAAIRKAGGMAQAVRADVTNIAEMKAVAKAAVEAYGRIDVMLNNAGVMPLALYADHESALEKWHRCIDINIKGVLNGTVAVHDQMIAQGEGHVINVSSIYGNFPVYGAAVYGATKSAVNFLSESLRIETRGKIKVTIVKPTGVPGTGLGAGVVNPQGIVGIVGQNAGEYFEVLDLMREGKLDPARLDPNEMDYVALDPAFIADQIIHAINQPKGVSIGDITVRASGDHYIL
ncbi:MAG: short-chain dehydrogenase [Hyphomonas sp.]|uniref:SDR family oxidoreductase n=1 Tax=Hyphomonas sp. TaxID=87 RepID=UPI0025B80112|nr:SDR family oxidoreductase [Hyphomonas sp.]MBA4339158.1 short-chain dehydrogenase [Hyphomonas sp.]